MTPGRSRSWLIAGLAVAVAVLGAWQFGGTGKGKSAQVTHRLTQQPREAVQRIRIERSAGAAIEVVRNDTGWRLVAPVAARVDPFRIEKLLDLLAATSDDRLPAADLARFDLDRPHATLTLGDVVFRFGSANTLTGEQYVAVGDAVYPVKVALAAALPPDFTHLIAREVFAGDEVPVTFRAPGFTVAKHDGTWKLDPPPAEPPSQDDLVKWTAEWRGVQASIAQPYRGGSADAEIRVTLADGREVRLQVIATSPDILLARPDEQLQYRIPGAARHLLSAPGTPPVPVK